jgi:hypothetical protein
MASSFVQVIWAPVKTSFLDGSAPVSAFAEALHGMSSPRWGLAQEDEALAAIALSMSFDLPTHRRRALIHLC